MAYRAPGKSQTDKIPPSHGKAFSDLPVLYYTRNPPPADESLRDPNVAYGVTSLQDLIEAFEAKKGDEVRARRAFSEAAAKPPNARAMREQNYVFAAPVFRNQNRDASF